jgi:hypothetical protein
VYFFPGCSLRVVNTTTKLSRALTVIVTFAVSSALMGIPASSAKAARWVLVGRELVDVGTASATVPTYVNTNSIISDGDNSFTVTFQARFSGRRGIDHVNIGVYVDCEIGGAYAEQYYVYYSKNKSDYERSDGGSISNRIRNRALSYC